MSNPTNSYSSPINDQVVQRIDQLNLSIIQKHHIRLLAHCLETFKEITKNDISSSDEDKLLREWCEKQSQKFNDKNFNEILYAQMSSAAKKLNSFAKKLEKKSKDLDIEDLIILVQENLSE